nr:CD1871A family CXXC motif-containing protein [[Clostridium] dakarense]
MQQFSKYILLLLSISFICIGMLRSEHLMVLKKAVKICLECIGVG